MYIRDGLAPFGGEEVRAVGGVGHEEVLREYRRTVRVTEDVEVCRLRTQRVPLAVVARGGADREGVRQPFRRLTVQLQRQLPCVRIAPAAVGFPAGGGGGRLLIRVYMDAN